MKKRSSYRQRVAGIFAVDKVKADILELKAQVASSQMRFLVCSANFSMLHVLIFDSKVRSQAAMLMRDCRVPGIQKEVNSLSESLATHVKDAQENQGRAAELFGVSQMSFRQKRTSLHRASMASLHLLLGFF